MSINLLFNVLAIFLISEDGHNNNLLSPNPGLIIWTIIIFTLLLILLWKFTWKPLLTALHNREEKIRKDIEDAERYSAEAKQIYEENKKVLAEANSNAQKILLESRNLANKIREEIINKANEEAHKILAQAKEDIERQKESALESIKNEVSHIAIKIAEKIIEENLDENKQRKLIEGFLNQFSKN
ncbi:MAG: F0F1 ATP synthase subunit B [Ignavibacteria bacterium]